MARKILTLAVLAAGMADVVKAMTGAKPEDVAAEILEIEAEKAEALKNAEQAEADKNDALALNDKHIATIEKLSKKGAKTIEKIETVKEPEFEYEGDTYCFRFKRTHLGAEVIDAEQVCADVKLQKRLVDINSGMIYKK